MRLALDPLVDLRPDEPDLDDLELDLVPVRLLPPDFLVDVRDVPLEAVFFPELLPDERLVEVLVAMQPSFRVCSIPETPIRVNLNLSFPT